MVHGIPIAAPRRNPLDATRPEEKAISDLVASAFAEMRKLPRSALVAAIKKGSAVPIFKKSAAWLRFRKDLAADLPALVEKVAIRGARFGVLSLETSNARAAAESGAPFVDFMLGVIADYDARAAQKKPILLAPEIAELGRNWARYHGAALVRGVDSRSRANLRRLIGNAARRLARNPRSAVLAQLAAEIEPYIGLTSHAAMQIQRWERNARRVGSFTVAERGRLIDAALAGRARSIAAREAAESFNEGVLRAARLAEKKNRVPQRDIVPAAVMKRAETMRDGNVRAPHQQISDSGPVRLDDVFPSIGGVGGEDRPPWSGEYG